MFSHFVIQHDIINTGSPVFGTGIVLVEQVSAPGIASQLAETGATICPVHRIKQTCQTPCTQLHLKVT